VARLIHKSEHNDANEKNAIRVWWGPNEILVEDAIEYDDVIYMMIS
jgi:hypothetical protein